MAEYDYSKVMELYKNLETVGLKKEADSVMSEIAKKYPQGTSAPPEVIQKGLEGIIAEHQTKTTSSAPTGMFSGKRQYALGLVGVLAIVSALALGMPYTPPPLY